VSGNRRPFEGLEGHQYVRLTTYRKSGRPVSTPVWFVLRDDRVHVFTDVESGKVKRIRNDPRVTLAPGDFWGRPRGESVRAEARIMDEIEGETADRALREKYGWKYKLAQAVIRLAGKSARRAFLELRPVADEGFRAGSKERMRYSEITFDTRNPIKRYVQRRRLRDALSVLDDLDERFAGKFLDYGGGSGELSRMIAGRFPRAEVFCYEPAPELFQEAEQNLSGLENVVLVSSLEEIKGLKFHYVFCLEVFEHLPRRQTARAIRAINRSLAKGGTAIVGVPNELFLPALLKGLFRMTRRYGAYDARPGNVFRAAIGRPPHRRPVKEIAPGLPYHFHHVGFDYRELRLTLSETFEVVGQFGSLIRSELLASEVYLVLEKPDGPSQPAAHDD
jgi:PPOX class probable F420-dependent enzyme